MYKRGKWEIFIYRHSYFNREMRISRRDFVSLTSKMCGKKGPLFCTTAVPSSAVQILRPTNFKIFSNNDWKQRWPCMLTKNPRWPSLETHEELVDFNNALMLLKYHTGPTTICTTHRVYEPALVMHATNEISYSTEELHMFTTILLFKTSTTHPMIELNSSHCHSA